MKRLVGACVVLSFVIAACGDNRPGAAIDASVDSSIDSPMIDAPDVDAMIDAMPTPAEAITAVREAANGAVSLPVIDATVTYIKPMIAGASTTNDPPGFTVQVGNTGPALFVAVDPATLTTLTPALAVGDVVSFTVTMKAAPGSSPRATAIDSITRSATGTDVGPLVQDITAVAGIAGMIADFDSELVDVTMATIAEAWGSSGSSFSRTRITTAGQPTVEPDLQLRLPTAFKDTLVAANDLDIGCVVAVHRTPVNRFAAQFQVSAFDTTDITVVSCPAPTVASAMATDSTHVTVTFSRNIDMATVMANGSQFTIVDDATPTPNALTVTAAAVTGARTVELTTASQTSSTNYTVTVANTVEDVIGAAIGTPNTATFTGFMVAPTVMMATAPNATTVDVTFTRPIDVASVMTDGSQFTIVDDATPTPNTLAVTAASVSGMVVTLTTAAQTPGTMYTVTVMNTVTSSGVALAMPNSAAFMGFTAPDHLVINEIDYDQPGADNDEFIEIYNPTNATIDLSSFALVLVSPNTANPAPAGVEYARAALTGMLPAGGYAVIGSANVLAAVTADIEIALPAAPQNGSPDGVAIINTTTNTLVDALSYEGEITMAMITGVTGTVSLVEGTAVPATTVDDAGMSFARFPNGSDTNQAATDWMLRTPTPGATN